MIARMWRGLAIQERADAYAEHLQEAVKPALERIEGFRGLFLMRKDVPEGVDFFVVTFWESMEAIGRFAGENPEEAVVEPAARALFHSWDSTVQHFEVLLKPEDGRP